MKIVPWSIVAALSFSFLECIFIHPGHLNQGRIKESPFKNKLFDLMKNQTIKLTKLTIRYRYLTICLGLLIFLLTGYVNVPKIKFKLFPFFIYPTYNFTRIPHNKRKIWNIICNYSTRTNHCILSNGIST